MDTIGGRRRSYLSDNIYIMKYTYFTMARALPAIIASLPFLLLYYYYLEPVIGDFVETIFELEWLGNVTIATATVFLFVQVNRIIAKEFVERRIFGGTNYLPTTNYLLHLNVEYSPQFTAKIHRKIMKDFKLKLPSAAEENRDEQAARQRISEAVGYIRHKLWGNVLLFQHNVEYGFIRNFIGGSFLALLGSIFNGFIFWLISPQSTALLISIVFVGFYFLVILARKWLVTRFGNAYARVLIQQYMADSV